MHLTELAISNFRCLTQIKILPSSKVNLILGANGAGKTSVLEAIFCLSRGRSFRANSLSKLIQDSHDSFIVRAKLASDINQTLAIQAARKAESSNYLAKINGATVKSLAELSLILPTIIMDPSIHKLIEDGPKLRRQYLDWGVFHVEPQFMHEWRRYQRALKQRNAGLKKGIPSTQLQSWTEILIESGVFIDKCRKAYIESLIPSIKIISSRLLQTEVKLSYRSGWAKDSQFIDALEKSSERERKVGLTVVGPHRADLIIQIGKLVLTPSDDSLNQFQAVQQRVSRGQQKLIAASLMLAQAQYFRETHELSPLLLIDDPFAELDLEHSNRLLEEIKNLQAQTFITTLNSLEHEIFENAQKFHVEHGQIKSD